MLADSGDISLISSTMQEKTKKKTSCIQNEHVQRRTMMEWEAVQTRQIARLKFIWTSDVLQVYKSIHQCMTNCGYQRCGNFTPLIGNTSLDSKLCHDSK